RPALPISHPYSYAMYLAKTQGAFCTLGLAEDTWALNERVLDEESFLAQTWLNHDERERMFFDAIDKTSRGLAICVFDATDRIQHMFWRYHEGNHPAAREEDRARYRDEIKRLYMKMDEMVGRTLARLRKDSLFIVMSDHGFKTFKRGVNLNTWLYENGYLSVKNSQPSGADWFQDVDWPRTRAYAVGLGGIYLNMKGREAQGSVEKGNAANLKSEIRATLRELIDPQDNAPAVREVYDPVEIYEGPYVGEAPDLIVGFAMGYRASWGCATGKIEPEVFEDNTKSWSGDHCVNPVDVPGVLFCNRPIPEPNPSIQDIGPTVLDLFGVPVPAYCDGKPLMPMVS
ncbi:alkaline phosphatase family protein, partial [bacterium]|nr:alkaline phosphatase family protein [bacterium]